MVNNNSSHGQNDSDYPPSQHSIIQFSFIAHKAMLFGILFMLFGMNAFLCECYSIEFMVVNTVNTINSNSVYKPEQLP